MNSGWLYGKSLGKISHGRVELKGTQPLKLPIKNSDGVFVLITPFEAIGVFSAHHCAHPLAAVSQRPHIDRHTCSSGPARQGLCTRILCDSLHIEEAKKKYRICSIG